MFPSLNMNNFASTVQIVKLLERLTLLIYYQSLLVLVQQIEGFVNLSTHRPNGRMRYSSQRELFWHKIQ
jgi:hypothetical protein